MKWVKEYITTWYVSAVHSQTGVNTEIEHRKKVIIIFVTVAVVVAVAVAVATFIILL